VSGGAGKFRWELAHERASQRMGSFEFTNTNRGTRYTTQELGNLRFTTGSDGSRVTTQRIGNVELSTIQPGSRTRWRWYSRSQVCAEAEVVQGDIRPK